jgi:hypothetical protein
MSKDLEDMENRVPSIEELLAPHGAAKELWAQAGRDIGFDFMDADFHDTHGLLAGLHFHFSERSGQNEADRFFADLMSGAGLPAKDPVAMLKKKMDAYLPRQARRREAPNRRDLATWIILAWNARRQGKPLPPGALGVDTRGKPKLPVIE